jgi:hypothetical protein
MVKSFPGEDNDSEIHFQLPFEISQTSWIALRASERKTDEEAGRFPPFFGPSSLAHTAAIYVTVQGSPPLPAQPRGKAIARTWLGKLEDLEARWQEDQIEHLAVQPFGDGDDADHIRANREALLQAIHAVKKYFTDLVA